MPIDPKHLRLNILRHLDAASGAVHGLGEDLILAQCRSDGFTGLTKEAFRAELQYLVDRNFITRPGDGLGSIRYRITADGRDYFAENEL